MHPPTSTASSVVARRRRLALRAGAAAAGLALGLLLAELGVRAWLAARGQPYRGAEVRAELERGVDTMRAFVPAGDGQDSRRAHPFGLLHPYYGSERMHDTGAVLAQFQSGIPADVYTVVVVGGSVAEGWSRDEGRVFRSRLEADPRIAGREVRVLRFAHASYKQPQQATRIAWLFSFGYAPDAVIDLDGFNEVGEGSHNAVQQLHPLYPTFTTWAAPLLGARQWSPAALERLIELWTLRSRAQDLAERAERWHLTSSCLLGSWVRRRMNRLGTRRAAIQADLAALSPEALGESDGPDRELRGPDFDPDLDAVRRQCARNWFEGSLDLDAMCRTRGVHYLHVLQPTLLLEGSKPVSDVERSYTIEPYFYPAVREGYPLLFEHSRELVRRGVSFADATRVFADVEETVFTDSCHLNAEGNRMLGALIADAFLSSLPD